MKTVLSQYSVVILNLIYKARGNTKNYETKLLFISNTSWTPAGVTFFCEKQDPWHGNKGHKEGWSYERKVFCACRKLAEKSSCIFHEWNKSLSRLDGRVL